MENESIVKEIVSLNVAKSNEVVNMVEIRTGEAKRLLPETAPKEVRKLEISGLGGTVSNFIKYRGELYIPTSCHALVNSETAKILLVLNEKQEENKHIDCVISIYPVNKKVLDLKLNTGYGRNPKELFKLLRSYKNAAANKELFQVLLTKLSTFSAKVNAEINNSDDRKGGSNVGIKKNVTHDIPESIYLTIPIIGNKSVSFQINIEYDAQSELFELYSDDFTEKYESEVTSAISAEVKEIESYCFVAFVQ